MKSGTRKIPSFISNQTSCSPLSSRGVWLKWLIVAEGCYVIMRGRKGIYLPSFPGQEELWKALVRPLNLSPTTCQKLGLPVLGDWKRWRHLRSHDEELREGCQGLQVPLGWISRPLVWSLQGFGARVRKGRSRAQGKGLRDQISQSGWNWGARIGWKTKGQRVSDPFLLPRRRTNWLHG